LLPNIIGEREKTMSHTKKLTKLLVASTLVFSITACGNNPTDRALSGAGIGAGAGAVGGALMGDPVTGAVLGGAAGAATGGLTSKKQIDLGKPAWK
jgi:uncharacterized membrane protein